MFDPYRPPSAYQACQEGGTVFAETPSASSAVALDEYPCKEGPCGPTFLTKLCVFYRRYHVVVWVTVGALFIAGIASGMLFTTATESKVKTCFGPDCYEEKPPELQGKVLAVGAPAETLKKLHTKPPPWEQPTPQPPPNYGKGNPWDEVRLPTFARPSHYKLLLQPDIDQQVFKGQVEITLELRRATDFIVFHAKNLTITTLSFYTILPATPEGGPRGKTIYATEKDMVMVPKNEQVFVQTEGPVDHRGNLTLSISFEGYISDRLEGLYMSEYRDGQGAVAKIVSTHFEPSSARRAFPCWDEPSFKAKFTISVVRPKGMISLSNMPLRKTEDLQFYQPGAERDDFLTTVPMSTYLVAVAVCDYVHLRSTTAKGVKISLYAPAEQISRGGLALNTAMQVLTYYEEFFGVSYPLPKLDMIAIPGFAAGAMENWGLVTFRMTSLLADDAVSSEWQKQLVVQTVAHELAHQWFGNLVTLKWWNDLWLNEGFASWVEVLGSQVSSPEWGISAQFYYEKVVPGLWLDSLQSSHPVSPSGISSVEESNALFDEISYNKGPALLRMVADMIGLPSLRLGLKTYLKTYKYGNADTQDLWQCLGAYSPLGIDGMKSFMNSWVQKQGYPLIEVNLDEGELVLRQRRFTNAHSPPCPGPESSHAANSPCSDVWYVRVICLIGGKDGASSREGLWLNQTATSMSVKSDFRYAKCNSMGNGFYRVSYSSQLWKMLLAAVDDSPAAFDPLDRASLISDSFALTWFGSSPSRVNDPMTLVNCLLPRETDLTIWSTAIGEFVRLDNLLRFQQPQKKFRDFVCRMIKRVYEVLGWVHEGSHQDKILRSRIMQLALHIEKEEAVDTAVQMLRSWQVSIEDYLSNSTSKESALKKRLPPDIRLPVYVGGVRFLNKAAFDLCFQVYKRCNNPAQRLDLLVALTKSRNVAQLQWLLEKMQDRDVVPLQDVRTLFVGVVRNPNGLFLAWRHLQKHWETLYDELPSGSLGSMLQEVLSSFNNKFDINQAENFFTGRRIEKVVRSYNQGLESAYLNVWWLETHCEDLRIWLEDNEPTTP